MVMGIPVIAAFRKWRQEDEKLETGLGYRSSQQTNENKERNHRRK